MKHIESSSTLLGIISVLIATASLVAQPYYNPCYGDRQEDLGSCQSWKDIVCTSLGSTNGKCRVPSGTAYCYGWLVSGVPDDTCSGRCYVRTQQTYSYCKPKTVWRLGTLVEADPSCPPEPNNGCHGECLNRQDTANQSLSFSWYEEFDCIDAGG